MKTLLALFLCVIALTAPALDLGWDAYSDQNITLVNIYKNAEATPFATANPPANVLLNLPDLPVGTTLYATFMRGAAESGHSNVVTIQSTPTPTPTPSAPTGFRITP